MSKYVVIVKTITFMLKVLMMEHIKKRNQGKTMIKIISLLKS
jgi:hypothetical protein